MKALILFISLILVFGSESAEAGKKPPKPPKPPKVAGPKPVYGPAPFPIKIKVIQLAGAGCPSGSASVTLSPDQSSFSILFDQLIAEAQGADSTVAQKKTCAILLGLKISGPYRLAIVGSDVRGFVNVTEGAQASIRVKHHPFMNVAMGAPQFMDFVRNFQGPTQEDVIMQSRFTNLPMWSNCGVHMSSGSENMPYMQINIDVEAISNNPSESTMVAIDSLDTGNSQLDYQLAWGHDANCGKAW